MSDIRDAYGHSDPWGEFGADGEGPPLTPEHLYCGPHEAIENIPLLNEVLVDFAVWSEEFRAHDVLYSKIPICRWEHDSPFSELKSIQLSMSIKEG